MAVIYSIYRIFKHCIITGNLCFFGVAEFIPSYLQYFTLMSSFPALGAKISSIFHIVWASVSSSFLPLLASGQRFVPQSITAKTGLVALPRWLPHSLLPQPWFAVSVHSVRESCSLPDVFGIGYVLGLGHVKVRDAALGIDWHIFCLCLHHISWLFLCWVCQRWQDTDVLLLLFLMILSTHSTPPGSHKAPETTESQEHALSPDGRCFKINH